MSVYIVLNRRAVFGIVFKFGLLIVILSALLTVFFSSAVAAEEEKYFTILHTNDEHGSLIPHSPAVDYHPQRENPTVGGYARLATAVEEIRKQKRAVGEPVLLLSAGDYVGGSPFSWLVPEGYAPEIKIKHELNYDAVIIGNHEYDYGADNLARYYQEAGYPEAHETTVVLASNTTAPPEHHLVRDELYRESYVMQLENGLKLGLFGLIGKDAVSVTAPHDPVEFTDQHEAAQEMVAELQKQGVDVIVAITHSGVEEDRDLALAVPGIDIIVGGHCHTALKEPIVEQGTIIVQAGSLLHYLGKLELAYNTDSGLLRMRNDENSSPYLLPLDYSYQLDAEIAVLVDEYTEILSELVAGKTDGKIRNILDTVVISDFRVSNHPPLQESPFGNFVTDAMRLITEEKTGRPIDFAIQANGSIRGSITPGVMAHSMGKVSFYDLAELIGLGQGPDGKAGYPVVIAYLTGEEVYRALEVAVLLSEMMGDTYFLQFSGLRYDFNPQNAILLTVPFIDLPIPTTRAVISAEHYGGAGRQGFDDTDYELLERGDEGLYALVTDSYILSFLPMVGEMLPQLDIVLKDNEGNPVADEDLDQLIVYVDGEELKVWQTVIEYADSQPAGDSGFPEMDPYYAALGNRINPASSFPLIAWPLIALALLIIAIALLIRRRKLRKKLQA